MAATSQNQKILAGPIALQVKTADEWKTAKARTFEFTTERPNRMNFLALADLDGLKIAALS